MHEVPCMRYKRGWCPGQKPYLSIICETVSAYCKKPHPSTYLIFDLQTNGTIMYSTLIHHRCKVFTSLRFNIVHVLTTLLQPWRWINWWQLNCTCGCTIVCYTIVIYCSSIITISQNVLFNYCWLCFLSTCWLPSI